MPGRYRKDGTLLPIFDPHCQRYIDDLDRVFYAGTWFERSQVERERERKRESESERYRIDPEHRKRKCERQRDYWRLNK